MSRLEFETLTQSFFSRSSAQGFEHASCIFCEKPVTTDIFIKDSMIVARCKCGFVFNRRQPRQSLLGKYYEDSQAMKHWGHLKDDKSEVVRQEDKYGQAVNEILKAGAKSVMDMGCGNGHFLRMLRLADPSVEAHGTEVSTETILRARQNSGAWIMRMELDYFLEWNSRSYDAITLWGVLEHIKDPISTLRKLRGHIKPGGVILVCVPNVTSTIVKQLWRRAYTFCPQHLWYFDSMNIMKALGDAGFKPHMKWTIESEVVPYLKAQNGFDPYSEIPGWAERIYLNNHMAKHTADFILRNNNGYKVVAMGKNQ